MDPEEIREEIIKFYKSLMGSAAHILPAVNKQTMRKGPVITQQQRIRLCAEVTKKEIYDGLYSIGNDKSPGVDGYNAYFFKKVWPLVKAEVVDFVKDFFKTGRLYRAISCTPIILVPKTAKPNTVNEYSPIACCTVLYKIIAKILASRLQEVVADIICESQAGFIPGRKIANNIFLSHELVKDYTRKNISPRCMIKIDLQKAYDYVEWPFVRQMLNELGFPDQFVFWIMECVQTVNYTVVINGEQSKPFNAARGLRQGDPISPFLFAIAMKYLSRLLNELKEDKMYQFHPKCAKLGFSLKLQDCKLILGRAVYFGGVKKEPLIEKITARITSWTTKKQSYAGRTQLAKSVLFGMQAYRAQLFPIPSKVLKTIDAYYRSYVWSGSNTITKKAPVAWDRVCMPKSMGGIGIINIKLWNQASQIKTCWDVVHKQDKMWIRWIHAYYIKGKPLMETISPAQASWITRKILESKNKLHLVPGNRTTRSLTNTIYYKLLPEMRPAELETREHLFVECDFAKAIWRRLQKWLKWKQTTEEWNQHIDWAIKSAKGKSQQAQIFKLVYAKCIYAIWMERNHRVFEKKSRSWEIIVWEIVYICYVRACPRVKEFLQRFMF
ncbi:PREDICTED: uncharacterized protein LOC109230079 [Nicotiana attenuata]|uniref:uncharacterized protein LOC109230079 n=1 Tax=Nicotiana attenuata TaxID=49451 RepID=UPI000904F669|nr:PREDICTED: uncharacterized protein LOC109230079 [Nicotiana attenuata]